MDRLWITEPQRATCLATVTAVQGDAFTVDRALFAPRSRVCRHPQYADQGTLWWDGEKRRLGSVAERGGEVWYTLRGTVPEVGAELQCQLDQDVRQETSRTHSAMHLALAALAKAGVPMVADPEVKGGGHFRITLARSVAPPVLAGVVQQVRGWIGADLRILTAYATRAEAERFATPQAFDPYDPVPGGDPVPLVRIGDVCAYPCEGTHVDRTCRIGDIQVQHARQGKDGFVVVVKVT